MPVKKRPMKKTGRPVAIPTPAMYPGGMLVDADIVAARNLGHIVIEPWSADQLGTNSYDVRLADTLLVYEREVTPDGYSVLPLDCAIAPKYRLIQMPPNGYVLKPGELYLASTVEYTESHRHVPMINGKSSLGRLGLCIHITAGFGDIGFCNHWTLEMTVVHPLRVYPNMKIAQLCWYVPSGEPAVRYMKKPGAKYTKKEPLPQPSAYWQNLTPSELLKRSGK